MGERRNLPITSSAWLSPLTDEEWEFWETKFRRPFGAIFRRRVQLGLLDFQAAKSAHYSKDRVSASELRKRIDRLITRHLDGKALDDEFAVDQVFKQNLDNLDLDFAVQATVTLNRLKSDVTATTMKAQKPEAIFTYILFNIFRQEGAAVSLTSGNKRENSNGLDPVKPTPIEHFILSHVLKVTHPTIRDVDKIRKNIKRFQTLV